MLKPQDVFICLKLCLLENESWIYEDLAASLGMSASEVHKGLKRANQAGLVEGRTVNREALMAFLRSGVQYAFYVERGRQTVGLATGIAARPSKAAPPTDENIPVWPSKKGGSRGYALKPLYRSAPVASEKDLKLYELLALVDAIRDGKAREKSFAIEVLERLLLTKT